MPGARLRPHRVGPRADPPEHVTLRHRRRPRRGGASRGPGPSHLDDPRRLRRLGHFAGCARPGIGAGSHAVNAPFCAHQASAHHPRVCFDLVRIGAALSFLRLDPGSPSHYRSNFDCDVEPDRSLLRSAVMEGRHHPVRHGNQVRRHMDVDVRADSTHPRQTGASGAYPPRAAGYGTPGRGRVGARTVH